MVIDGNRLILIIGKKILFKKNSKSELSPKKIRPDRYIERFHIFTRLSVFDSAATTDGRTAKPLQYGYRLS